MDKFCRDCRHARFKTGAKPTCESPDNEVRHVRYEVYLVTGVMPEPVLAMRGASCAALRIDRGPEINVLTCGPEGKWWQAKEDL